MCMFKDRGLLPKYWPILIMLKLLTFPFHVGEVKLGGVSGSEEVLPHGDTSMVFLLVPEEVEC